MDDFNKANERLNKLTDRARDSRRYIYCRACDAFSTRKTKGIGLVKR